MSFINVSNINSEILITGTLIYTGLYTLKNRNTVDTYHRSGLINILTNITSALYSRHISSTKINKYISSLKVNK